MRNSIPADSESSSTYRGVSEKDAPLSGLWSSALRHLWQSPWTFWVGFRYLKSKKNSHFLSFITLLSVMGVALGVTAMITVLSVMNGFEAELKKRMMSSDLHILVQPTVQTPGFEEGFVPIRSFAPEQVEGLKSAQVWSIVSTEGILKTGRKVAGVVLKGVTPPRLDYLKRQLIETSGTRAEKKGELLPADAVNVSGLYIGQELAYELGLVSGDFVTLVSPTETDGPGGEIPRLKKFMIEGVYHSGLPEQELHTVFAQEGAVRSFLKKADVVSQWEITVPDFDEAPAIAAQIRDVAPELKVQDWIQLNSSLFASLQLERLSMFIILAFIIVVASFNIVTTLTMMVLEKKKEISILKAMGARHAQVAAIFLAEGGLIGTVGVSLGVAMGYGICSLLKNYEFIQLPDIYYDRTLPVTFDYRYYVGVALIAIVIVLSACFYPSKRAAKLNPIDGIRFGS